MVTNLGVQIKIPLNHKGLWRILAKHKVWLCGGACRAIWLERQAFPDENTMV